MEHIKSSLYTLVLLILSQFFFVLLNASDVEGPKWIAPTLTTKSNLFRQTSVIGFPNISFHFGAYFIKKFDKKCFNNESEPHLSLVRQASSINKQVYNYVNSIHTFKDTGLSDKIKNIGEFIEKVQQIYEKFVRTKDVVVNEDLRKLHDFTKNFERELLKESRQTEKDSLFKVLISKMQLNEANENCQIQTSSIAIATGLLISTLIPILQMGRIELFLFKNNKNTQLWNDIKPIYQSHLKYFADTIRIASKNGSEDSFTCNYNPDKIANSYKMYIGEVKAAEGNVVIGVRYIIENGILYVQIKEGKLLPFGQTIPNQNWTSINQNPSSNELTTIKEGCTFLLSRQSVPHDQVVVGVTLTDVQPNECMISLVVHGRKADLLEGRLLEYRRQFYAAKSVYTISPIPSKNLFTGNLGIKHYITSSSVNAVGVTVKQEKDSLFPFFDKTDIESVPATAHTGLEVTLTVEKSGISFLRLRLISVNMVNHLATLMHFDSYPEYFYVEE